MVTLEQVKQAITNLEFDGEHFQDHAVMDNTAIIKEYVKQIELSQKCVVKQFPRLLHKVEGGLSADV